MKNIEKWPTHFSVVKVVDSFLSKLLKIYLIVGILNQSQLDQAISDIDIHAKTQIDEDRFVIASLVSRERLEAILEQYRERALRWRGQYQAMSKALVAACEEALR